MNDITRILRSVEAGDSQAATKLLPLIYDKLRELAAVRMAHESPDHTLQPTALVHEAYLRLVDGKDEQNWDSRGHFYIAAAEAMRRILIENARGKHRQKRGVELRRVPLDAIDMVAAVPKEDLLTLDEALNKLSNEDPVKAEVVRLRFFAGLSHEEVARVLGVSLITVKRHWRYARAWLHRELSD